MPKISLSRGKLWTLIVSEFLVLSFVFSKQRRDWAETSSDCNSLLPAFGTPIKIEVKA
jgi:hypothetical protein